MTKLLIFSTLMITSIGFSQIDMTVKNSGKVVDADNKRLSSTYVKSILESNPKALHLYNVGKTKEALGDVLLGLGIGTFVGKHLSEVSRGHQLNSAPSSNTLYFVGIGMVVVSLPIKIGFSKKIKSAVNLYKSEYKNTSSTEIETSFISNNNGVGISITF